MFKVLRIKEIILLGLVVVFIPVYAFYTQVIAPRFSDSRIRANSRRQQKVQKKLNESLSKEATMQKELASLSQRLANNDGKVARMHSEAKEFKRFILSDRYEVELYHYLFGRDARYSILGLGNTPKRIPKGNYTEIIYNYICRGKFQDIVKIVKKIENTSRSLSISKLSLEKPTVKKKSGKKPSSDITATLQIHVIFSGLETGLSFDTFREGEPSLELIKIGGNPWDSDFGETRQQTGGPTAAVKKLFLKSVIYMKTPSRRAARFSHSESWYQIDDEFQIEQGKPFTTVRVMAIGGRYVVVKHLGKNQVFKISLRVSETGKPKGDSNTKQLMDAALF
jgi:hypothetical protein